MMVLQQTGRSTRYYPVLSFLDLGDLDPCTLGWDNLQTRDDTNHRVGLRRYLVKLRRMAVFDSEI